MVIPFIEMGTIEGGSHLEGWGVRLSFMNTEFKIQIRYSGGETELEAYT